MLHCVLIVDSISLLTQEFMAMLGPKQKAQGALFYAGTLRVPYSSFVFRGGGPITKVFVPYPAATQNQQVCEDWGKQF